MASCTNLTLGSGTILILKLPWSDEHTHIRRNGFVSETQCQRRLWAMTIGKPGAFWTSLQRQVTRSPCFSRVEQTRIYLRYPWHIPETRPQWNRHRSLLRSGLVGRISRTTPLAEGGTPSSTQPLHEICLVTNGPIDYNIYGRTLWDPWKALQAEKIHMWYLHGSDRTTPFEETLHEGWQAA